jgi:hypothetical protein
MRSADYLHSNFPSCVLSRRETQEHRLWSAVPKAGDLKCSEIEPALHASVASAMFRRSRGQLQAEDA